MSNTSSMSTASSEASGVEAMASGSDALLGLAALGKTAAALALVVAIIFLCSYLVKRWGPNRGQQSSRLRVVGNTVVGNRERVVIVEVENTWLVLGVGGGQVNKLHEMPAPEEAEVPLSPTGSQNDSFATRFAQALKHNAGQALGKGRGKS